MATKQQITQSSLPNLPRGTDLLDRAGLNKGTAFTEQERSDFGLDGLLPPHIENLNEQVVRAYGAYKLKDNDLERHIYLRALQDTNGVLFYRLVLDHGCVGVSAIQSDLPEAARPIHFLPVARPHSPTLGESAQSGPS